MRAEPWLDEIRHGINPSISFGCDCCATTRRKRDVACCVGFWTLATREASRAQLVGVQKAPWR